MKALKRFVRGECAPAFGYVVHVEQLYGSACILGVTAHGGVGGIVTSQSAWVALGTTVLR